MIKMNKIFSTFFVLGTVFVSGCINNLIFYTGQDTFKIDSYTFRFVNEFSCKQEINSQYKYCEGKFLEQNIYDGYLIEIATNRTLKRINEICVHEICHTKLQQSYEEEEPICVSLESYNNETICNRLIDEIKDVMNK